MNYRYAFAFAVALWVGGGLLAESAVAQRRRGVNTVPGPAGVDPVTEVNPVVSPRGVNTVPGPAGVDPVTEVNPVVSPRRVNTVPGPAGVDPVTEVNPVVSPRRVNTVPGPAGVDPVTEVNPVVGPRRVRPVPGPAGLNNPVLLKTLPPNYRTVVVAGVTYYVVDGVYYIYDPGRQGYVVVAAPQ